MFFIVIAGVLIATLTSRVITSTRQAEVFAASCACLHGIEYALVAAGTDAVAGGRGVLGVDPAQQGGGEPDAPMPVFGGPGVTPVQLDTMPPVECYAQGRWADPEKTKIVVSAAARCGGVTRRVEAEYGVSTDGSISQHTWRELKPE
jgi:hypothetical protein